MLTDICYKYIIQYTTHNIYSIYLTKIIYNTNLIGAIIKAII